MEIMFIYYCRTLLIRTPRDHQIVYSLSEFVLTAVICIGKALTRFYCIQISVDCSAKTSENLSELFYYAQKTVLHPSPPLYSVADGKLNEKCVLALNRIFTIVDTDQVVEYRQLNTL